MMDTLGKVVQVLKKEEERLNRELRGIRGALAAFGHSYAKATGRPKLSVTARARIAAAQKARWAKARNNAGASTKVVPIRRRRTLSASARRKIAAAQRARWARLKAGKKMA
jgi:hypothetical protein